MIRLLLAYTFYRPHDNGHIWYRFYNRYILSLNIYCVSGFYVLCEIISGMERNWGLAVWLWCFALVYMKELLYYLSYINPYQARSSFNSRFFSCIFWSVFFSVDSSSLCVLYYPALSFSLYLLNVGTRSMEFQGNVCGNIRLWHSFPPSNPKIINKNNRSN